MKNVNKNDFKNILKGVIIGGLIFGGIGVAAVTLTADQIKYTPSNEKFTATNVKDAMDEIYKIAEYKIPENTYFYEEGTEGDSTTIVRYKKINDEYFVCDENGIVAEGTAATDVTSKTLIEYSATAAGNMTAGSAGYASNSFFLGDGSDNAAYFDKSVPTNFAGGNVVMRGLSSSVSVVLNKGYHNVIYLYASTASSSLSYDCAIFENNNFTLNVTGATVIKENIVVRSSIRYLTIFVDEDNTTVKFSNSTHNTGAYKTSTSYLIY